MLKHKYRVGQNVQLAPTIISSLGGSQQCVIVRLLPIQDGDYLYRIKCVSETVERIAKEGDLKSRGSAL